MECPHVKIPDSLKEKDESPISFKLVYSGDTEDQDTIAEGEGKFFTRRTLEEGKKEAYISVDIPAEGIVGTRTCHHFPLSQEMIDAIQISESDGSLHVVDPRLPKDTFSPA